MARLARVVLPGYPHHVTQRGVRSMKVFRSDDDRRSYLDLMAGQAERAGLDILAWCLMSNHVHIVAVPERADSLARGVGEAHRLYTRMVNFRERVRGHLFQERFFSCPLDERHFLAAARYVELNPVRARIAALPWEYPWSSARFHVDRRAGDTLVATREPFGMKIDWRELLTDGMKGLCGPAAVRKHTRTGRPLGSEGFIDRAEEATGRELRPRRRGPRPKARRRG